MVLADPTTRLLPLSEDAAVKVAFSLILASECTGSPPDGEMDPLVLMGGPGIPGMLGTMDMGLASEMTEGICTGGPGRTGMVWPLASCTTSGRELVGDPSCLLEGGAWVMTEVGDGSVGCRGS